MWHVSSRSGVATLVTYLLTYTEEATSVAIGRTYVLRPCDAA